MPYPVVRFVELSYCREQEYRINQKLKKEFIVDNDSGLISLSFEDGEVLGDLDDCLKYLGLSKGLHWGACESWLAVDVPACTGVHGMGEAERLCAGCDPDTYFGDRLPSSRLRMAGVLVFEDGRSSLSFSPLRSAVALLSFDSAASPLSESCSESVTSISTTSYSSLSYSTPSVHSWTSGDGERAAWTLSVGFRSVRFLLALVEGQVLVSLAGDFAGLTTGLEMGMT